MTVPSQARPRSPVLLRHNSVKPFGRDQPSLDTFSSIVLLLVGPCATPLYVHESLLKKSSTFFSAALSPVYAFAESHTKTINLPEDRSEDVAYFLQWLYSSRSLRHPKLDELQILNDKKQKPTFSLLLRLWTFADKYNIRHLQNDICDKLISVAERENACPNPGDTWTLYEEMNDGARIRDVVLDLFTWKRTEKLLEEHEDAWHEQFLRNLAVKMKKAMRERDGGVTQQLTAKGHVQDQKGASVESALHAVAPWKLDACCYHEHIEGEECFSGREHERPLRELWL